MSSPGAAMQGTDQIVQQLQRMIATNNVPVSFSMEEKEMDQGTKMMMPDRVIFDKDNQEISVNRQNETSINDHQQMQYG